MKLLFYISTMRNGGAERVMSILCNHLVERGHEVYLATDTDAPFAYQLRDAVRVKSLYPENFEEKPKFMRFVQLYASIRRIAKEVQPDVIVSFTYVINAKVLLATLGLRIPVVACERTTFNVRMSVLNKIRRLYIARLADCLTVQTQYDYNYLGKRFRQKVVMPNPLDFSLRYKKEVKEKIVLTVGSVDRWEDKGFDGLIKLWGNMNKRYPDWELWIVGDGNKQSMRTLEMMVEQYRLRDCVRLLGYREDVCDLMYKSAVFVLASKQEGMPNCLIEAMSQGCACVSFDCIAGPREIITDGVCGLLIGDQNWQEMREKLEYIIEDDGVRERFAVNALKEVGRFSVDRILDRWEVLFKQLVSNK